MRQRKSGWKCLQKEKGVLTIEASISYSIFLMIIVTMLYIMRIVYAYGLIQHAVGQTAKELSMYTYLYQVSGMEEIRSEIQGAAAGRTEQFNKDAENVVSLYEAFSSGNYHGEAYSGATDPIEILKNVGGALLGQAAKEVSQQMFEAIVRPMVSGYIGADSDGTSADERLRALQVVGGLNGLDFSGSSFFEDGVTVDLVVCYTIAPIMPINIMPDLNLSNRAYVRGMSGKTVFSPKQESQKKSVWDIDSDINRGKAIQEQEGIRNLPDNFSVYSAFDPSTGKATAEVSIDLNEKSYQDQKGIENSIRRKCNKIENYKKTTYGGVTLDPAEIKEKELIIYIPSSIKGRDVDRSKYDEAVKTIRKSYPNIRIVTKEID